MVESQTSPKSQSSSNFISEPPPYYTSPSQDVPVFLSETRTTEIVTTTTTTHLFSLPLSKKRVSSLEILPNLQKDLPPTPKPFPVSRPSLSGSHISLNSFPNDPSNQSATSALAQAALGVGLSYTLRPDPSSDVNTVLFSADQGSSSQPPPPRRIPSPKPRSISVFENHELPKPPTSRRTRGLSLNTSSLFSSVDSKGKGKETVPSSNSPKALSRKPSFWSRARKKSTPSTPNNTPPALPKSAQLIPPLPQLPSFQPLSPLAMDISRPQASSPRVNSQHQRGLSRSHSERFTSSRDARPQRHGSLLQPPIQPPPPPSNRSDCSSPPNGSEPSRPSSFYELPPRRRSSTNPPLLQRWSMGLFSSSSLVTSPTMINDHEMLIPQNNAPSPASQSKTSPNPGPPSANESPELYLQRILMTVNKAEVTGILASSGDTFHTQALRVYIQQFDFVDDPLDIALRRLLMDVHLPRETQQIDRVMEAFASRYSECNSNLFVSSDHPYIVAFSLIMLHTDVFNKSNKRKMTKADYVKNTRLPGVPAEVLDCFYDNVVFAPFIFIEDPLDVNGQHGLMDGFMPRSSTPSSGNNSSILGKSPKIDPYFLISNNLLAPLRINVDSIVPRLNPYRYKESDEPLNETELHDVFANATVVEVGGMESNLTHPYALGMSAVPASTRFGSPVVFGAIPESNGEVHSLHVTKFGVMARKDDRLSGGKRSTSRKWKKWGILLTGSQVLLFRDPAWVSSMMSQWSSTREKIVLPQAVVLRPDELLSVKDSVAVYDSTYTKYRHTMRFVLPDQRHILFQASNDTDLDEWISCINYASAFKSAGIRMRAMGMSGKDLELTGLAAASSHLHDMENNNNPRLHSWGNESGGELLGMLSGGTPSVPAPQRRPTLVSGLGGMEFESPAAPEVEGADQFKATFDQVKSDLASGNWTSHSDDESESYPSSSTDSLMSPESTLRTRAVIVQSKLTDIAAKALATSTQLDADLRFIRNIGLLTPFQRVTRDRLILCAQAAGRGIMNLRLELTKYTCHKEVLAADLLAERRVWREASKVALRSATETISSQMDKIPSPSLPTMTVSHPTETSLASPLSLAHNLSPERLTHHRPESSICESFHSALDFSEWAGSNPPSSHSLTMPFVDSPQFSSSVSSGSYFPVTVDADVTTSIGDTSSAHEKFYTARDGSDLEDIVAEDWNKTRCAQRVSLVRVPSNIAMIFPPHLDRNQPNDPSHSGS